MAGIYLHIPFCKSKCIYCGFYSVANLKQKAQYLDALKEEIVFRNRYLGDEPVQTIYFGGGTPSLLSAQEIRELLKQLRQHFNIVSQPEITLECNPEQLVASGYCDELLEAGINRISIGVQSFQEHVLQFMGRRHNAVQAQEAVAKAHQAGFQNISIDLIYGVSERTDEQWQEDIGIAKSLPIQHLSAYALTPEENSILYKQIQNSKHAPVDDEQAARQYQILIDTIAPFEHYEVSNFALPGFGSKHNQSYWDQTPYLGLGAAAHSFDGNSRQWNPSNLKQYFNNISQHIDCEDKEDLSSADLYNEMILLGLRTRKGISLTEIRERFGEEQLNQLCQYFRDSVDKSYYEQKESRLRLTETGLWFADGIASDAFIIY